MTGGSKIQWNMDEIAGHLKSAVDTLTPDVLDRIDLSKPQEQADISPGKSGSKMLRFKGRMRAVGSILAACLCVLVLAGGVTTVQNNKVASVIGIDVNPSVELSVNRKDKVLKAEPLNSDAVEILEDMDLEDVDLNIAVNALIGSMVKHGYLDDLDNAILVTVSNDDKEKAADMRQTVVGDIEKSLEENQIHAVVYDQQAEDEDDVKELAEKYGISYGKAYFLKELIDLNSDLSEEDMENFASMTMEEIAKEITERSYVLGEKIDKTKDPTVATTQETTTEAETKETTEAETTTEAEITEPETTPPETTQEQTTAPTEETATAAPTEETTEEAGNGSVKIDNVDYDSGTLEVDFEGKVKWKNPTVSVEDSDGASYSAKITDKGSTSCQIEITGLAGGKKYTFTISGVGPKEGGKYTSVKGRFDAPDVSDDATEAYPDETEEETKESTEAATDSSTGDSSSEYESTEQPESEESSAEEKTSARETEEPSQTENSDNGESGSE